MYLNAGNASMGQSHHIILCTSREVINIAKTNCIICNKVFDYVGYKKKCCSNQCLSEYRRTLAVKQHDLNYDNVIGKIEKYIVSNFIENNIVKTLNECLIELHIAPKTYYKYCNKYNISYDEILSNNNISKQHSKFQTTVTNFVRQHYNENYHIIEEKTFKDCVNPKTNCLLKFDIYIKELSTIIECDGVQHYKESSYFNTLTIQAGYTPTYITDKIKEEYCKNNNIKLIRIPYERCVTKEYVDSFLCA